jgi:hypothetical protein
LWACTKAGDPPVRIGTGVACSPLYPGFKLRKSWIFQREAWALQQRMHGHTMSGLRTWQALLVATTLSAASTVFADTPHAEMSRALEEQADVEPKSPSFPIQPPKAVRIAPWKAPAQKAAAITSAARAAAVEAAQAEAAHRSEESTARYTHQVSHAAAGKPGRATAPQPGPRTPHVLPLHLAR